MTLGDWMDIAWAELVASTPTMANPGEYHTTMFEAFWNGNFPTKRADAKGKTSSAKAIPRAALAELEAEMEAAMASRRQPKK